jgi:hypothetical protein
MTSSPGDTNLLMLLPIYRLAFFRTISDTHTLPTVLCRSFPTNFATRRPRVRFHGGRPIDIPPRLFKIWNNEQRRNNHSCDFRKGLGKQTCKFRSDRLLSTRTNRYISLPGDYMRILARRTMWPISTLFDHGR